MTIRISSCLLAFGLLGQSAFAGQPAGLHGSPSLQFFTPSLGERVAFELTVPSAGRLDAVIVDRDGFPVRKIADSMKSLGGKLTLTWDGKNQQGEVVPDEAYSVKLDLKHKGGKTESYFPANGPAEMFEIKPDYFDRASGVIRYKLSKPCRVHMQAGTAVLDPETKTMVGPVLKTIVNREPRAGGSVVETWNGFDESGTIFVPDLPHVVVSIMATALPEGTVIVTGTKGPRFLDRVPARSGHSLFTFQPESHHHHSGLQSLEDVSPHLELTLHETRWDAASKTARVQGSVRASVTLVGPSARAFAKHPGNVMAFLDTKMLRTVTRMGSTMELEVALPEMDASPHVLAVNWVTEYGPVAVNATRIVRTTSQVETPPQ